MKTVYMSHIPVWQSYSIASKGRAAVGVKQPEANVCAGVRVGRS